MTEISAAMVKQLRDATSAGMMDCKRALQETGRRLRRAPSRSCARKGWHRRPSAPTGRRPKASSSTRVDGSDRRDRRRRLRDRAGLEERRLPCTSPTPCSMPCSSGGRPGRSRGAARRRSRPGSARTSRSSAPAGSRQGTARFFDVYLHPPAEQDRRRSSQARGRLAGARPPARDAHLLARPTYTDARRDPGGARRRRARDPAQAARGGRVEAG